MDEIREGSSNLNISEISSADEVQTGTQQENREFNYLFVFDNENNNYEFNTKCEKDIKKDESVFLSKEYSKSGCPPTKKAIEYFREIVQKINVEIKNPSSNIPVKSTVIYVLKYLGCFLVFLIIIYLFLLILVLSLFNPMIIILEILFMRNYLNFFLSIKNGISENIKKTKIISLIDEENGKYTYKGKILEWKYGRDGSWIEIKYKKKLTNTR